jgi:hypothetical protein
MVRCERRREEHGAQPQPAAQPAGQARSAPQRTSEADRSSIVFSAGVSSSQQPAAVFPAASSQQPACSSQQPYPENFGVSESGRWGAGRPAEPQPWVGAVDLWILAPDLDSRARPSTSLPGNRRSMHAWQHDEPTTPASCQCLKSSPCRPAPATGQPDGPHRLYAACSPCASPGPP